MDEMIRKIDKHSELYPNRMKQQPFMPEELYYYGSLPDDRLPTVGIIGARVCSTYGEAQAYRFAEELSNYGVQIISGLARGIDVAAHKGALKGKTPTYGVLGCGVDICYPTCNKKIYQEMKTKGGVLSEFEPGTAPNAWHFPVRNRIISALSDIILVVEARVKSGTQITVEHALEQGKTVYAVPGRIQDQLSLGCHLLIEQGAGIAYSPETILRELHLDEIYHEVNSAKNKIRKLGLSSEVEKVYKILDYTPQNVDQIQKKTGVTIEIVLDALIQLEMYGLIKGCGVQNYIKLK